MLISGTVRPFASVSVALPDAACTVSATCASLARRPRLMRLCEAFSRTSTSLRNRLILNVTFIGSQRQVDVAPVLRFGCAVCGHNDGVVCSKTAGNGKTC
eukprot:4461680-Pleurochrysis_carterae.AAC.1